ncbi:MAG: DUF4097 family beta strand repeat-containing protein [Tuberibacillus sp.]
MGLARIITEIIKSFTGMFQMAELYQVKEIEAADIHKLKVSTRSTNVSLVPADQETIKAELKGQVSKNLAHTFVLDAGCEEPKSAHIRVTRNKHSSFGFNIDHSKLIITVPKKQYGLIDVQTSSGDIEGKTLKSEVLKIRASSGDIKLRECQAKTDCSIEASSGDIQVSEIDAQADISVRASSGNIRIRDAHTATRLRVRANSGNLDAQRIGAEKITLNTSSGDIRTDEVQGNLNAEASSGNIKVMTDTLKGDWYLKTSSGDISLQLVQPESLSVEFTGNSGEAKIFSEGFDYQTKSEHRVIGKFGAGENRLKVRTSSGDFRLN